jgi:hypothetical protein
MKRLILAVAAALGTTAAASAQQPFQTQQFPVMPYIPPQNIQPNLFNPVNQPLSPYLNLLRGGNTATNYYYGVRPGTVGGFGFGLGAPFTAPGGNRPLFFPQLANAPDPFENASELIPGDVFPPAGHPTVFNNTLGYFPGAVGARGAPRTGLAGVGASRPPGR